MKKLLSLLTITTMTTSVPAPLLASAPLKRATNTTTNPSQCGNSCDLVFTSVKNSGLVIIPNVDTGAVLLDFTKSDILLPNFPWPQKQFYLYSSKFTNLYNKNGVYKKINGYRLYTFTHDVDSYWLDEIVNVKISFEKVLSAYRITSFSAEIPPFPSLDWTKTQSQFNLVDSAKTMIWTRPDLIAVDGELNIEIANPNIDKVVFDNVPQPQTAKKWTINVKPETAPRDHNLQVTFTLDGKQYTSEIMVSMLAKIATTTPVQKQLSELIKKTDLENILDNNDDTISLAVNKANSNIVDDFSQIEIINKENNKATLTAKKDSKSYQGSVDVTYNVVPSTIVDLKIDLQPTTSGVNVDSDYLAQFDSNKMTNKVDTFYYANSESVVKMIKPTPSSVISGVIYGCDDKWNKTSQQRTIDPTKGIKLDGSQLGAVSGKYLIELKNELGQTNTIYLQISNEKVLPNYFNTDKGKQFEQRAEDNGYKNIRASSASQLNNLFALSPTWKQSLKHLDLKLDNFVVDNIKNVSQNEIDTYKTKLLNTVKSQVEKYVPDVVENIDYAIGIDNLAVGDWTTSKDVTVQAVEGSTKLLSFTIKTISIQQKDQPTLTTTTEPTSNSKGGDSKLWIIGVVVGVLAGVGVVYLLFHKFIFNKYILPKIYARRQQKVVEQWKRDDREEAEREEKQNNKKDNNKGGEE